MKTATTATIDRPSTSSTEKISPTTGSFTTIRPHLEVESAGGERYDEILTPGALEFLAELHDRFAGIRHDLLAARLQTRVDAANGRDPKFRPETARIRQDPEWRVAGAGPGLEDRRVEITGPTDRKMAINALNSGAKVWLADQEDATSPTWANVVEGQLSLFDAVRGQLTFTNEEGREYRVTGAADGSTPTIVMRPRGWHLVEKHISFVDRANRRMASSGSLIDFGLYFFHNAQTLIERGSGPYFYLPKLESSHEARLWNDIFSFAEERLGIAHGTIRAKTFRSRGRRFVFPDRREITMTAPFMRAYTELLVATCHRRGAYAIGGMSAFIPNRRNPDVTERALAQVAADKNREATDGFDGTWVAHPDLIPTARAEFDAAFGERVNQLHRTRDEVDVTAAQLLDVASIGGGITEAGVSDNITIALRYIESWLRGVGAAAIDNLMEDAATAEISRSQIWQWIHNSSVTVEGRRIDRAWVEAVLCDVISGLARNDQDRFDDALEVFRFSALEPEFPTFLTVAAYARFF